MVINLVCDVKGKKKRREAFFASCQLKKGGGTCYSQGKEVPICLQEKLFLVMGGKRRGLCALGERCRFCGYYKEKRPANWGRAE